ncbi:unnamed protein product [Tilletia laevis]|uniref:Uncharacterized protein n=1 Tax=Tilletia controversa TaxID=13291 RepID=A0A8X7T0Z1_9BASI|nr:hypothetical protein CF328_g1096 [Tilletia controversa]CAD6887381.1 unnamed protein product [Tilletia caries]CAD6961919.1 unnamed protein product [Tilletia laevis]KAE8256053.1 hypothetical protein A4X06_0g107 [Tilletia controversa]CAD6910182.1 unnamed protein product [Tilletia caries]
MRRWIVPQSTALLWSSHSLRPRLIPAPSTSRTTLQDVPALSFFGSSAVLQDVDEVVPPKRGRGRPPKQKKVVEEGEAEPAPIPRARATAPLESPSEVEEAPVKRKRGRPRKTALVPIPIPIPEPATQTEGKSPEAETIDVEPQPRPSGRTEVQEVQQIPAPPTDPKNSVTLPQQASVPSAGPNHSIAPLRKTTEDWFKKNPTSKKADGGTSEGSLVDPTSPAFLKIVEQERQWETNPWMHMLASPLRRCCVSKTVLPADLLICFKQATVSRPGEGISKTFILPDRILHPKFALTKIGKGIWVLGSNSMVDEFLQTRAYRRQSSTGEPPKQLMEMIAHQLRQRVLQEAELLVEKILGSGVRSQLDSSVDVNGSEMVANLDLRVDAPVMIQGNRDLVEGRSEADATVSFGQPVTFGLRRLMGFPVDLPSSDAEDEGQAQDNDDRFTAPMSKTEHQDRPEADLQSLLLHFAQSDPIVASDPLRNFDKVAEAGAAEGVALHTSSVLVVRKHSFAVPLFIALYRLACFIE